jgi:ComF family protein
VLTIARSGGRYEGSLRSIVHAFKFDGRRALAMPLATLMRTAGAAVLDGADVLIPVPLHPWRALQRGFNQADDLAVALGLPVWRVLTRRRHGPPQTSLLAPGRRVNVRNAFRVGGHLQTAVSLVAGRRDPRMNGRLRGRDVVLIDDVMTTGATLEACGRVLVSAGVRSVRALTAARVASPLPPPRP